MTPDELRKRARFYGGHEGWFLVAHEMDTAADAWDEERIARHMEAAKFLSQIAAWKASCKDAEKRLEAAEKALRLAAGMISTQPPYADKHPQEAYDDLIRMAKEAK
jgi:hypothetical protein